MLKTDFVKIRNTFCFRKITHRSPSRLRRSFHYSASLLL